MKIVIAGAGTIGVNVAAKLSQEGHDLFLIDNDNDRLRSADESLDLKTVVGDATSVEDLRSIKAGEADLLIAVTKSDTVNILACQLASKLGAKKNIARIRRSGCFKDPSILTPYDLGIDLVIFPEKEVAREILQLLFRAYATEVVTFFDERMEVVGLVVNDSSILVGKNRTEMEELSKTRFNLVGIVREDEGIIPVDWDGTFQPGDKIYIVAPSGYMPEVAEDLGFEVKKLNNIFIYGGSAIGLNLARSLETSKVQTRILEPSRTVSRELAYELKKVLVLQGEGTDSSLLEGEGIEEADVFAAVTDDEEANLLSCILAKQMGAVKSVALVTKPDYVPLISALDVDAVISKRLITINRIMRFVRRGEVVSVSELSEEKIEAIEFRITNNTIVSGMELSSTEFKERFPKDAIIGGIQQESGDILIPDGSTELNVGDRVMVYCSQEAVKEVEKIFV
ncbi:Trk system potassium transporter TrkA [Fibrobacterota bacterium]